MTTSGPGDPLQGIITRCWADEDFKQRLLADPAGVLAAAGVELPEGITLKVIVESETERAVVIPALPRSLSDEQLAGLHGGASCRLEDTTDTCMQTSTPR